MADPIRPRNEQNLPHALHHTAGIYINVLSSKFYLCSTHDAKSAMWAIHAPSCAASKLVVSINV